MTDRRRRIAFKAGYKYQLVEDYMDELSICPLPLRIRKSPGKSGMLLKPGGKGAGLLLLLALLSLSGCTRYAGDRYTTTRRSGITLYDGSSLNTRVVRNNIWSSSSFLKGVLPAPKNRLEVYITDRAIPELLGDRDFLEHIFSRIEENRVYDEKEREKARLLATTDLREQLENPALFDSRSIHIIPVANIIILRYDENYGSRHFLYGCVSLMLYDSNPSYYLNPSLSRDEVTDHLLFRFMLTGFPSFYSRYFSKFPGRKPTASLYSLLAETDIQYLDSIYDLDLEKFASLPDEILYDNREAALYYAWFFEYLFRTAGERAVLELIDTLFTASEERSAELRRIYKEWKAAL